MSVIQDDIYLLYKLIVQQNVLRSCLMSHMHADFLQPDDIALPMRFGEKNCVMESTLPITLGGAQPSIQSLTQVVHMHRPLNMEQSLWVCFVLAESRFLLI